VLIVILVLIVLAALLVANLLLTVALAQRVRAVETGRGREHAHDHGTAEHGHAPDAPPAGSPMPAFRLPGSATEPARSDADLRTGSVLVAFFSTDCRGCLAAMPDFARTSVHDYERVLAVVKGDDQTQVGELTRYLVDTPAVVAAGPPAEQLWLAFDVGISPSFYEYRDGNLTGAHLGYGQFRAAVLRTR
jgi:hypothetical protein